ncbi:MAG: GGDEF domain-containing protein [Thermodesulfobacteriota bacterium]
MINQNERREFDRIVNREFFLYLLDLEVKRARRYQEFFCVLVMNLCCFTNQDNGHSQQICLEILSNLLKEEFRDSDILGNLSDNRIAAILPYADVSAASIARARFEGSLKYCDFEKAGYGVKIDQICFPADGTDINDLVSKVITPNS